MKHIRKFWKQKEVITYLFWGVMTTIVNYAVYFICTRIMQTGYLAANLTAWIFAVLFAYVTNKLFVFCTCWNSGSRLLRELISFVTGRVASLVIETMILYLFIDLMQFNDIIVKLFSNVIVVILNYIFAKLFTFRKNKELRGTNG
jgi:putative flippase GtrA